jgi:hypothetical protein
MGPYFSRWLTLLILSLFAVFVFALPVQSTQISGTISSTLTITDDSELVGDVTCKVEGNACILMAAYHIKLNLNGFTMKGTITGCTQSTSLDDGIDVIGEQDVDILGPGLIQGFGGFGIFVDAASKVKIKKVTISDNCFSGIILVGTTDSDIEKNVSVRNSLGSEGNPCGGT